MDIEDWLGKFEMPDDNLRLLAREGMRIKRIYDEGKWFKPPEKISGLELQHKANEIMSALKMDRVQIEFFAFWFDESLAGIMQAVDKETLQKWVNRRRSLFNKCGAAIQKAGWKMDNEAPAAFLEYAGLTKIFSEIISRLSRARVLKEERPNVLGNFIEISIVDAGRSAMWEACSDFMKEAGYDKNPFKPMVDIMEMGLVPFGLLKIQDEMAFWIGVPIEKKSGKAPEIV